MSLTRMDGSTIPKSNAVCRLICAILSSKSPPCSTSSNGTRRYPISISIVSTFKSSMTLSLVAFFFFLATLPRPASSFLASSAAFASSTFCTLSALSFLNAIHPSEAATSKNGIVGIPGTIPNKNKSTETIPSTMGFENISFLISSLKDSSCPLARDTIKPVEKEIKSAGN